MEKYNSLTIGERIKQCRLERGMTQKDLAERMGISPICISQYETGKRVPKIETIDRIASAIGVDPAYLSKRGGENMLNVKNRPASEKEQEAIRILQAVSPILPEYDCLKLVVTAEIIGKLKDRGIDYKQLMDVAV